MAKKPEYPKLPKAFKKKWLEALRSGKYEPAQNYLHVYGVGYCCLGVACKISGVSDKSLQYEHWITKRLSRKRLPKVLVDNCPSEESALMRLAKMNDAHKSFKQIANWIEKNL